MPRGSRPVVDPWLRFLIEVDSYIDMWLLTHAGIQSSSASP
jgi:hypothetical protein